MMLLHSLQRKNDGDQYTLIIKVMGAHPNLQVSKGWDLTTWQPTPATVAVDNNLTTATVAGLALYDYVRLEGDNETLTVAVRMPLLGSDGSGSLNHLYTRVYMALLARAQRNVAKVGLPAYVFIRQRYGERCPVCWDTMLNTRVKTRCEACYDTGFAAGYSGPVLVRIGLYTGQESRNLNESANVPIEITQYLVRLIPDPYVPEVDDLIYVKDELYRFDRLRVLTNPMLYMDWGISKLQPNDIRMKLKARLP